MFIALFFLSFQIEGMENTRNEAMQTQINNYINAVQELTERSEFYMEELKVNGRDYSELVADEKSKISELKYKAEAQILYFYQDYVHRLNAFSINAVNRFVSADRQNSQLLGKIIKRPFLIEKAQEQKEEEIRLLRGRCGKLSKEISDFYNKPLACLDQRNDTYVSIYFSLRSLESALTRPIDQNNPQEILAHYEKIKSCFDEIRGIIGDLEEDFEIVFSDHDLIFEQEVDVMGTCYLFACPLAKELLIRQFMSDFNAAFRDFSKISLTINGFMG
jgi:hypothetical protein